MGVPKTSDPIKINIRIQNPSQEPSGSSKAPHQDFKDMDVLCTFNIKIESQNLVYGSTKDQWPYPNQYQDAKPQWGTSSILQSHKSVQKGRGCSLHLKNQDRKPKFRICVNQRPVTISKSIFACKTPSGISSSKLFWAKLIWDKIEFESWASLSWPFRAKLIWE